MGDIETLSAELERLYQRQADLRAHEVDLAERGENDPASDEWKLAAVAASGAEADFRSALVRNYSTISRVLREAAEGWIKITSAADLPKKPGLKPYEYVDCLIFHKGEIKKRPWNCEHLCWDDEEYDDFYCDALEPTYYMRLPAPPTEAATLSQETRNDD